MKLTYKMKKNLAKFHKIWSPFLTFLENCDFGEVICKQGERIANEHPKINPY